VESSTNEGREERDVEFPRCSKNHPDESLFLSLSLVKLRERDIDSRNSISKASRKTAQRSAMKSQRETPKKERKKNRERKTRIGKFLTWISVLAFQSTAIHRRRDFTSG